MSTELTHNEVLDLLPAFVLGALEPAEMLAVQRYIQHHPELLPQIASFEAAAMQLVYAAPDQPLPTDVRARLLARVETTQPRSPAAQPALVPAVTMPPRRRMQVLRSARWLAVGAVVVALLGWNIGLQRRVTTLTNQINQLVTQADTRTAQLVGTPGAPNASGRLHLSADGRQGVLTVSKLPALPPGKAYQFWFARPDKSRDSAAVFQVGAQGEALINVVVPGDLRQYNQIWITQEPVGGSAKPTPPHFLEGPL